MSDFQLPPLNNHKQFEHLICDLLNEINNTFSFKCYGKNGHNQKGIDVFSTEKLIIAQCKSKDLTRGKIMLKKEMFSDIEETIKTLLKSNVFFEFSTLVIATTLSEHPDFDDYCQEIKLANKLNFNIIFWGWESIQKMVGNSTKTLLKYYPQFNTLPAQPDNAQSLAKYRVSLKKKIEKDFSEWLNYPAGSRSRRSRMLIRNIKDRKYPEHETNEFGEYNFFAAEIDRLSVNGIGFIDEITLIYVLDNGKWTKVKPQEGIVHTPVRVSSTGVIDFADIIDYDLSGDEHGRFPHFFCNFNHKGKPFSEYYYTRLDSDISGIPLYFDITNQESANII